MLHRPELLPDELMGGYLGRLGRINGINKHAVRAQLHEITGRTSLPVIRRTWCHALAGAMGMTADMLAREHTTLPLLRALRPAGHSLSHAAEDDAKLLRLVEMALPDEGPRLCPQCVNEDQHFWGISYWRRSHQIRGVSWCTKHNAALWIARSADVLTDFPEEAHEDSLRKLHVFGDMQTLHRFVDVVEGLMDLPQATPSHQALLRLHEHGKRCHPWHPIKSRRDVGLLAQRRLEGSGLELTFPRLLKKSVYAASKDNAPRDEHWSRAGSGYAFALMLTALYDSADEALFDLTRPWTQAEQAHAAGLFPTGAVCAAELLACRA